LHHPFPFNVMAKKRKKIKQEEEEKYEFVPPEFDEKQFLTDEIKATKRILLIVGYGVLFGVLATLITVATGAAILGLLLLIVGFASMKFFFSSTKIDMSKFTKRTWLENGAWFFFTFLAIWILTVNPPFFDLAPPDVRDVKLWVDVKDFGWSEYNYTYHSSQNKYSWVGVASAPSVTTALQSALRNGTMVNISARIVDNSQLSGIPSIIFRQDLSDQQKVFAMNYTGSGHRYEYEITSLADYLKNNYLTFRIIANDAAGHQRIFNLATEAEVRLS